MGAPKLRTPAQNRALRGLLARVRQQSGLNEADAEALLRRITREVSGQESTRCLTEAQAGRAITRLQAELGGPATPVRTAPRRAGAPQASQAPEGTITPEQQRLVQGLMEQAGLDTRARQVAFCRRQCGAPWPQTRAHVDRLVHALQAMVLREADPAAVRERARALQGRPELDVWQRGFVADLVRQFDQAERGGTLKKVLTTGKLLKLAEAEARCGHGG